MRAFALFALFVPWALVPALARADEAADLIGQRLFPPELIMSHQKELGIDDRQREAIVKEVQGLQSRVVEVQWQMQAAVEELVKQLDAPRVDEARALAQADKVMGFEREVKRAHLGALIRIRNLLTDAQRAKLVTLRAKTGP
jgi:Spy/CpxP family protein refolding chaperone